jgi:c-di-GMP-binding flagellar brake protein YcgR
VKLITPEVGSSIEIEQGEGDQAVHWLARVEDETPGGLILSSFDGDDAPPFPSVSTPLRIRFHQRDAGYEFDSIILNKREAPFRFAYIALPTAISRRQLRAYLRVDCQMPISLIRRDDQRRNVITGMVVNISGGGMLVSLMVTIPPEIVAEAKFDLEEGGRTISNITARVLSIRAGEDGSRVHVMQFDGIDDEQRTAIIRHTFSLQQKAMKLKKAAK